MSITRVVPREYENKTLVPDLFRDGSFFVCKKTTLNSERVQSELKEDVSYEKLIVS